MFSRLNSGFGDDPRWHAERRFEESRVNFLYRKCGLERDLATLRELHRDRLGYPGLNFSLFQELYPSFPIVLGCDRLNGLALHESSQAVLPAWYKSFAKVPFVPAFERFCERAAASLHGRGIGLIFPRKGFRDGLIIYTGLDDCWNEGGGFIFRMGKADKSVDVIVRPFADLVAGIYDSGRGWVPD